jgi:hypothetical protein
MGMEDKGSRIHYPIGVTNQSPGLRGTIYPGKSPPEIINLDGVVSIDVRRHDAIPVGVGKMGEPVDTG